MVKLKICERLKRENFVTYIILKITYVRSNDA